MVYNPGKTVTFGTWRKVRNTLLNRWISVHFKSLHVRGISNMMFPICRTSGSGACHLYKDNRSSLGPKWQQTFSPPNHIWRETHSWAVGISDQYCCLWPLPGSCNQSSVSWHRWKPLFHVTCAAPDGDGSEEDSGEWECPCQEWGTEARSGKDFSMPCCLREGCRCCCGSCHGDVPQKIKSLSGMAWDAAAFFFLFFFPPGFTVFPFTSFTFSGVVFNMQSYSLQWKNTNLCLMSTSGCSHFIALSLPFVK